MSQIITEEVRAMIGMECELIRSAQPVEMSETRRFTQAIMDDDPVYWDPEVAKATRYEGFVAPPLYPVLAFRRPSGTPDPLDNIREDPDFDGDRNGGPVNPTFGLPLVPIPLVRALNGGSEVEFYQCARVGEYLTAKARYADIYERQSKSGAPMVFIVVETSFFNERNELLLVNRQTIIRR